jgi:hypothetical protein
MDMAYFAARDDKPSDYCRDAVGGCDYSANTTITPESHHR